jgi:uncharacterized membrane protein YfhO
VANVVADTRAEVDQVLNQVATQPDDAMSVDTSTGVQGTALNAASESRETSSSLQVTTRDGDLVTIDIKRSQSLSAGVYAGEGGILAYADKSASTQLDISVKGDLSESEISSIKEIVKRVNELANKLLSSDMESAMEKLGDIEFDSSQLSDLVLNISSNYSYRAISAYSGVKNIPAEVIDAPVVAATKGTPGVTGAIESSSSNNIEIDTGSLTSISDSRNPRHVHFDHSNEHRTFNPVAVIRNAVDVIAYAQSADVFKDTSREVLKLFENMVDSLSAVENKHTSPDHVNSAKQLIVDIIDAIDKPDNSAPEQV